MESPADFPAAGLSYAEKKNRKETQIRLWNERQQTENMRMREEGGLKLMYSFAAVGAQQKLWWVNAS